MAVFIDAYLLNLYLEQDSWGSKKFDSHMGEVSVFHCDRCDIQWLDFLLSLKTWKQYLLYRKLYFLNYIIVATTPPLYLNSISNLSKAEVIAAR